MEQTAASRIELDLAASLPKVGDVVWVARPRPLVGRRQSRHHRVPSHEIV